MCWRFLWTRNFKQNGFVLCPSPRSEASKKRSNEGIISTKKSESGHSNQTIIAKHDSVITRENWTPSDVYFSPVILPRGFRPALYSVSEVLRHWVFLKITRIGSVAWIIIYPIVMKWYQSLVNLFRPEKCKMVKSVINSIWSCYSVKGVKADRHISRTIN